MKAFRILLNNNCEAGKAYYNSLAEGDEFQYTTFDGKVKTAKKITPNYVKRGGLYKSAACELTRKAKGGITKKRYPKFKCVIVN